jgi:hypothetical protein
MGLSTVQMLNSRTFHRTNPQIIRKVPWHVPNKSGAGQRWRWRAKVLQFVTVVVICLAISQAMAGEQTTRQSALMIARNATIPNYVTKLPNAL